MKKIYPYFKKAITCAAFVLILGTGTWKAQSTLTYTYTGSVQTYTIPCYVQTITLTARGVAGQPGSGGVPGTGGSAALVSGVLTATPGQVLYIYVGGQTGFNGGGAPGSGGPNTSGYGGDASDVRLAGIALTNRILVAAGGGGGSGGPQSSCASGPGGSGGNGGMPTGTGGTNGNGCALGGVGGSGATQTAAGNGGTGNSNCSSTAGSGAAGILGMGGTGGIGIIGCSGFTGAGGGGGGGGYYGGGGGGGGAGGSSGAWSGGGGGGGSSYIDASLSNGSYATTTQTITGLVTLSYVIVGAIVTATATPPMLCSGSSASLTAGGGVLSYTWSPGGSNASSIIVSPTSTSSYTVQGINSLGCISGSVINIPINTSVPAMTIVNSTTSICPSNTVILTASGAVNYTWTGGVTNGVPFSPPSTANYTVTGANGCGTSSAVTGVTVVPLPVVANASPTVICVSNAATLTAAGANTFTWLPVNLTGSLIIVAPTTPVIYTLTGSSNVCSGTFTLSLPVNPNPTLSISASSPVVCEGTAANLTASGALTYTWQPGGSNAPSITVNPTITSLYTASGSNTFGCVTSTQQIIMTTPAPIVTVASNFTTICLGASAVLLAGGANTYTWNTGPVGQSLTVTPTGNTTYTVTGTSNLSNCSNTKTISISVFIPALTASNPTTICSGTQLTLNASGATSYNWSNNLTGPTIFVAPNASTVYIVSAITVTNGMNCPSSRTIAVTVNPNPLVTAVADRSVMCTNEKNVITAGGATSYLWSNNATTNTVGLTPTSNIILYNVVTGTDNNGCVNTASVSVYVNNCTGINEDQVSALPVTIFPNPSNGIFTVNLGNVLANVSIRVYNTRGHLIKNQAVTSESTKVDFENEDNGLYFIDLIQDNKSVHTSKIVKQ